MTKPAADTLEREKDKLWISDAERPELEPWAKITKFCTYSDFMSAGYVTSGNFDLLIESGEVPKGIVRWNRVTWERRELCILFDIFQRVYFVQMSDFIKIGYTANLKNRMHGFKTSLPLPVDLLASIYGTTKTEKHIHEKFARHREQGEWFRRDNELLDFIEAIKA